MDILKEIEKEIVQEMKDAGIYEKRYNRTISVLARTQYDLQQALELHEKMGGKLVIQHTNKNGATNFVKHPVYLSIEKLRSDLFAFSKELGLTPGPKSKSDTSNDAGKKLMDFINK